MPQLDELQQRLEERKGGVSIQRLADMINNLRSQVEDLKYELFEVKKQPRLTEGLENRFTEMVGAMDRVADMVHTDYSPVLSELEKVSSATNRHRQAIDSLEMPKPQPLPEIPSLSLEPLLNVVERLNTSVSELASAPAQVIENPRNVEWVFDIQRGQGGAMKKVTAKAVK